MVTYAINRYLKLGFNLSQGTDIKNAIKGISGTQVAHLEPNRIKGTSKKKFSLPGNSNWFKWHWPIEGEFAGLKRNELVNILQEKMTQEILSSDLNAGDVSKSDRYTAEDMLNELHSMAHKGLLEDDKIPKLTTVSNWISGYAKNTSKILQNNQSKHQRLVN
ncbi:hypothetical protein C2G38_2038104 [Gigaspora rosea]|uniref:Uncharacterized protein n=1 Tax=Gigaspora rosea TaxID=44941 RepID=A0A397VCF7_9GLOM|nr:hypothetical protein C2G38_2038104 [Gigaspora rosea]